MFPNANRKPRSKNTKFHNIVLFIAVQFLLSAKSHPGTLKQFKLGHLALCVGSANYPGLAPRPMVAAAAPLYPVARSGICWQLPLPPLLFSHFIKKFNTKLAGRRSEIFESFNVCRLLSGLDCTDCQMPADFPPLTASCVSNVQVVT